MKLSSIILSILALAIVVLMLWIFGPFPARDTTAAGATAYDPAREVELKGVVTGFHTFACPESGGEMGGHLTLQTSAGSIQVHLAPTRWMVSQNLSFAPAEQITVVGSEVRVLDRYDVIARQISRDSGIVTLRDPKGNLIETHMPAQ